MEQHDEDLLIEADSYLSLIYYREKDGLTERTLQDLNNYLPRLRLATNRIISIRRNSE